MLALSSREAPSPGFQYHHMKTCVVVILSRLSECRLVHVDCQQEIPWMCGRFCPNLPQLGSLACWAAAWRAGAESAGALSFLRPLPHHKV